jgi:hypothetical protein
MLALSKADLRPDLNVFAFRDLLIDKVGEDISELRQVLAGLVEASDALSVGEDFVLLWPARFDAEKIEVTERVGMELVLPLAAILPFERHVQWIQTRQIPQKVVENLLSGAGTLAGALIGRKSNLPGPIGLLAKLISPDLVTEAAKLAGDKLREMNAEALAKQQPGLHQMRQPQLDQLLAGRIEVGQDRALAGHGMALASDTSRTIVVSASGTCRSISSWRCHSRCNRCARPAAGSDVTAASSLSRSGPAAAFTSSCR